MQAAIPNDPAAAKLHAGVVSRLFDVLARTEGSNPLEVYGQHGRPLVDKMAADATGPKFEPYNAPQEGPANPDQAWQQQHAGRVKAYGLTERQAKVSAPAPDLDPLTGLYSEEEMLPAIQRAANEGGWHYAEANLSNLGGINNFKGGNSHADEVIKEIGDAWQKHFPEIAARHGAAQFSALTRENPTERLGAVKADVARIIEKHGMTEMPNKKTGGKGAQLYTGQTEAKGGVDSIIEQAQNQIKESEPKEVSNVDRSKIRQAWLESLGGQAGRTGARIAREKGEAPQAGREWRSETESAARPNAERRQNSGEFAQPEEYRLAQHNALFEKEGIKHPEAFQPHTFRDKLTGWFTDRERIPTIARVQHYFKEHPEEQRKGAVYAAADVGNLGGLNDALGEHHANEVFRGIADIFAEHLHKLGGDVVLIRHGGDEFSAVVVGADRSTVEKALADARTEAAQYIHSLGLEKLPHAKEPFNPDKAGVGMYTDSEFINHRSTPKEIIEDVDAGIELAKKVRQAQAAKLQHP